LIEALSSLLAICLLLGCSGEDSTLLRVYHAGSLCVPFQRLEAAFEAGHPAVDVRRQALGSAEAIRQVTELGKPADIVASSDYQLIDRLMIQTPQPKASWNLLFARNAICIAYRSGALPSTTADWAAALKRAGVRVGISNPNNDPCGYRSLMALYLAQERLKIADVFDAVILRNSNISVERDGGRAVIRVPTSLSFRGSLVMRAKETDLVALLQSGALDCLLIYRSIAVQQGLAFVELPAEASLGSPDLEGLYSGASVRLFADGEGCAVEVAGGPILYGITIPHGAPQPELAREFVELLLSERGRAIVEGCGQQPLWPPAYSRASSRGGLPF